MNTNEHSSLEHTEPDTAPTPAPAVRVVWWKSPKIMVPLVIVVLLALGGGTWLGVDAYQAGQARAAYAEAVAAVDEAQSSLAVAIVAAEDAQSAAEGRDIDDALMSGLSEVLATGRALAGHVEAGDLSRGELAGATEELGVKRSQVEDATRALTEATDKVMEAVAKAAVGQYAAVVSETTTALDEAKRVLSDSDGKVADNATRDALSTQIEKVAGLLSSQSGAQSGSEADWKSVDAQRATLVEAKDALVAVTGKVAESRAAWQKEQDEKNTAAGAAPATSGGSGWTGGSSYTGGGYASGGGGGYTAPSGGGSAPATSQPTTGGEWIDLGGGDEFGNTWEGDPCWEAKMLGRSC